MELIDLRVFARVATVGSISGTARALGMPKSSVSRSLTRLEEAVGATLLERSTRHLRLTDAGMTLQRHARRILNDVAEAQDAVAGLWQEARGDLRVTAPLSFATGPIAAIMPSLMRRYPELRIALSIENRIVDLLEEEQDVAIRVGPLADSTLIQRRLTQVSMWLCASPSYIDSAPALNSLVDLSRHLLISYGHGRGGEPWTFRDTGGVMSGSDFKARIVVQEPAAILATTINGTGVGLLPDFVAAAAVQDGRLLRLLPHLEFGSIPVHALFPSHRGLSATVKVFLDALADFFKQS